MNHVVPLSRMPERGFERDDLAGFAAVAAGGLLLFWMSAAHPAEMPVWGPFEFSAVEYLAAVLASWWYVRGLRRTPRALRPPVRARVWFGLGVFVTYAVLQTRLDYVAQHAFFVNRLQHLTTHHLGPFLLALSWPGAEIKRGMPAPLRRVVAAPVLVRLVHVLQQPILAAFLFVGLVYLWLWPAVHLRAMLDPRLYAVMNWSMVADGVLFWALVLDPRPQPPARLSYSVRMLLALGVQLPQVVLGAVITFCGRDLYPSYTLCGRIFSGISASLDQQIGGSVIIYPAGMMSALAFLLIVDKLRRHEETQNAVEAARRRAMVLRKVELAGG